MYVCVCVSEWDPRVCHMILDNMIITSVSENYCNHSNYNNHSISITNFVIVVVGMNQVPKMSINECWYNQQ
jgi:hypothetical protein